MKQRAISKGASRLRLLFPPILFATLTLAIFHPVLFGDTSRNVVVSSAMEDVINEFLPMRVFGFDQLRHGHLPLWNPYIFGGVPYFAGFQAALLYPLNWLHLLLPATTAINWLCALHIFLAALNMFAWVRSRDAGVAGSILAGVTFMFSGPVFLRVYAGHLSHLNVLVWTPLLLLAIDQLSTSGNWKWCLLGAAAITLQILGGSPQYVYYTGLVTVVYVGILLWQSPHSGRLVSGVAAMFSIGSLLTAVQLFTGVQALGESVRSNGTSFEFASNFALPPEDLLTLAIPNAFGGLWHEGVIDSVDYFGRSYLWESSMFIGVTGLTLAVFAVAARWRRCTPLVVMVIVTIALALGRLLPVYRILFGHLPLYGSFRATSKFVFFTVLFLCPLSADGLDALIHSGSRLAAGRAAVIAAAMAVLLCIFTVCVGRPQSAMHTGWIHMVRFQLGSGVSFISQQQRATPGFDLLTVPNVQESAAWAAATLTAAALLLAGSRIWRRAGLGFVALAILEMIVFARSGFVSTSPSRPYPAAWRAAMHDTPGNYRVLCYKLPPGSDVTYLDWGMTNGAQNLWGYDPGVLKRYAELLTVAQGLPVESASQYLQIHRATPGLLQMLRCQLGLTFKGDIGMAIKFPTPLGVAQLIPRYALAAAKDGVLAKVTAADFNPRQMVILESKPAIEPASDGTVGPAKVTSSSTDSLEIKAQVDRPTLLLITNNYSTGWHATPIEPNGLQPTYDVMPANYTLMAIPLAAGQHHIRLQYQPLAYRIGRTVSVVSVLMYLIACAAVFRRGCRSVPRDVESR